MVTRKLVTVVHGEKYAGWKYICKIVRVVQGLVQMWDNVTLEGKKHTILVRFQSLSTWSLSSV